VQAAVRTRYGPPDVVRIAASDRPVPKDHELLVRIHAWGPVRRHVFRPVWDRACRAVGLKGIRPEWLRHTGGSLAYAASRDMKAVASRLGHTSTRMMDTIYVEVCSEVSRQLVDAIDDLVRESTRPVRS
jgi:integrase